MMLKDLKERETHFVNGSRYKGTWNTLGMDGVGRYVQPYNVTYEGEFLDGAFHGNGSVNWPRGQRIDGIWIRGESTQKRYTFKDSLIFATNDWQYCQFPDRRFHESVENGLRPAGATLRTNNRQCTAIPDMCYDTANGIFHPNTGCITSYTDPEKVLEIPTAAKVRWIKVNCRMASIVPTGHRTDLYENWFSHEFDRENLFSGLLPFSDESPEPWWKRLHIYRADRISKVCCGKRNSYEERFPFTEI